VAENLNNGVIYFGTFEADLRAASSPQWHQDRLQEQPFRVLAILLGIRVKLLHGRFTAALLLTRLWISTMA